MLLGDGGDEAVGVEGDASEGIGDDRLEFSAKVRASSLNHDSVQFRTGVAGGEAPRGSFVRGSFLFDPDSDDPMKAGIASQVRLALEECDVVICVVDALVDILGVARIINSRYYSPYEAFLTAALLYMSITFLIVFLIKKLENRWHAHLQPQESTQTVIEAPP